MDTAFDVAVVGAGPAGSMTAWGLARAGMSVALLDRATFPRDKVCGDALLPDAVQALEEAALLERVRKEALAVGGAVFRSPGGHMLRVGGDFLTIRRERLDAMLVEAAGAAGARFFPGFAVTGPLEEEGEVRGVVGIARAEGAPALARLRARVVVLACGSHPRVLEPFGVLTRPLHSAIALRGYLPRDPFPGLSADGPALFISYDRTLLPGYGWAFPMRDGSWNVGCGVFLPENRLQRKPAAGRTFPDLRRLLARFLDGGAAGARTEESGRRPPALDALADGTWWKSLQGATLRTGFAGARPVRGPVVVVGEALGLTLPLTGDGIGKAMQSGLIAARAIAGALRRPGASPELGAYARELEEQTRPTYDAYAAAQRWMRVPAVPDLIVRRAARHGSLRRVVEEIVAEKTDPRVLLSPLGLVRTLVPRRD